MKHIDNRLDSFFGPSGSFAGYVLFAVGFITIIQGYLAGAILIPFGALMSFTYTGTEIDAGQNKFRNYSKLFGLFKTGKWLTLNQIQHMRIIRSNIGYTVYSRGNRPLDIKKSDYRLVMESDDLQSRVVVMASKSKDQLRTKAEELSQILNIPYE
jgi:hypothetical protein